MAVIQPKAKQPWQFDNTLTPELRSARALEYIAHYLDRIETHMATIAHTLTADPADGELTVIYARNRNGLRALQDIAETAAWPRPDCKARPASPGTPRRGRVAR